MKNRTRSNGFWIRISVFGIWVFVLLYITAAVFYPGGSQLDKTTKGFSWLNNYWCDLLSEQAKNGQTNSARPIAIISWTILCFSLSISWYFLPQFFETNTTAKRTIRICGIGAMLVAALLFTSLHDVVIRLAGGLGFIAFVITLTLFYRNRMYKLFYSGLFCVALMGLNYYIMIADATGLYLPVIQKVTFIIVLFWILFVNKKLYMHKIKPSL
jgi:hypothetical protein